MTEALATAIDDSLVAAIVMRETREGMSQAVHTNSENRTHLIPKTGGSIQGIEAATLIDKHCTTSRTITGWDPGS